MSNCYDYVRKTYGIDPVIGARVKHTVTGNFGKIIRARINLHYVHVRFDGRKWPQLCHPTELDYSVLSQHDLATQVAVLGADSMLPDWVPAKRATVGGGNG